MARWAPAAMLRSRNSQRRKPHLMPEILALLGLVIATVLYLLLVRRRSSLRSGVASLGRALSASNEIALARIASGLRPSKPEAATSHRADGSGFVERRSGQDRRKWYDRRRGRGRRAGGDRRRGASST